MFEKIGRLAETAATKISVSRRGFLGRLGQGALAAAGALGGLLLFPKNALANGSYVCCIYKCRDIHGGSYKITKRCYPPGSACPGVSTACSGYGGAFIDSKMVNACSSC
jgi:hypothetical protein